MWNVMKGTVLLTCLALSVPGCGDDDGDNDGPTAGAGMSGGSGKGGSGGNSGRGGTGAAGKGGASGTTAGRSGSGGSKPDGLAPFTLRFKAKVGDEDFACGTQYEGVGKSKLKVSPKDFRFFVEEVKLIKRDGTEVPFELDERSPVQTKDVALIDFADLEGRCADVPTDSTVNTELTGRAPAGDYDGVVFVNGVPEALNHADITLASPPLTDTSTNWNWKGGYRFVMVEAFLEGKPAESDAGDIIDPTSLVHIGSSVCTGTPTTKIECEHGNRNRVRLTGFNPSERAIIADFAGVFAEVKLEEGISCHSTSAECAPLYAAFGVDMATGEPLTTQSVFRVE